MNKKTKEMYDNLVAYIRFRDNIWYIDFSNVKALEVSIVLPDGSKRPASPADGDLFEVMELGEVIDDPTL
jgi:hypothetical protein